VSSYQWRDGVGPVDLRPTRPNPAWASIEPEGYVDRYVRFAGAMRRADPSIRRYANGSQSLVNHEWNQALAPHLAGRPATLAEALYDTLFYHVAVRNAPLVEVITHSATVNHGGRLRASAGSGRSPRSGALI
jgi:hypothetical protein